MTAPFLLIGATGQIGRNILRHTGDRPVVALARRAEDVSAGPQTSVVRCDLAESLPDIAEGWPLEALATTPVWALVPHFDSLADRGVRRIVCFSTTSIFGKSGTRNARERVAVDRISEAERVLQLRAVERGVGLTILRPTLIYGEGQDKTISAAGRFIARFGVYPVYGEAMGKRQPVHADDLAAAALLALADETTIGRTYALGGADILTYRDMVERIFATLEKPSRILRVPMLPAILDVAGRVTPGSELTGDVARRMNLDLDFDDGTAAREFGYKPRPFLQGGKADLMGSSF